MNNSKRKWKDVPKREKIFFILAMVACAIGLAFNLWMMFHYQISPMWPFDGTQPGDFHPWQKEVSAATIQTEPWEPPDPCTLESVVCDGEEINNNQNPFLATGGVVRSVSAYNSVPEQTDSTPCIGASGDNLCELYALGQNICASNAFPLGTQITVDGLGTCIVLDRMNRRYTETVDWYMGYDVQAALNWGRRNVNVTEI